MDTSETYIKMCDCGEIQEQWRPIDGDLFFDPQIANSSFTELAGKAYHYVMSGIFICDQCWVEHDLCTFDKFYPQQEVVFLPRQGQIQEMMFDGFTLDGLLDCFNSFWNPNCELHKPYPGIPNKHGLFHFFKSIEQLWLAFYMHEKHNKIWDNEKWVKSNV